MNPCKVVVRDSTSLTTTVLTWTNARRVSLHVVRVLFATIVSVDIPVSVRLGSVNKKISVLT